MFRPARVLTNQWVVPYSPYLCLRYGCHINVEACISSKSTKYIYKYVTKGGDRAMARAETDGSGAASNDIDEIADYQDMRSVGASEACWRLYQFPMQDRYPAVEVLQVHLPDQNIVHFNEGAARRRT